MKNTVTYSVITLVAALLISLPATAGKGRGYGNGFGERDGRGWSGDRIERMRQHLSLTSEQVEALRTMENAHLAAVKPIREKMAALRAEVWEAWKADTPDEGAILELHREIQALSGQLAELRIQYRIDMMTILTPEQRRMMGTFREGRRGGGGAGRGMGYGGFGPGCGGRGPSAVIDGNDADF